MSFDPEMKSFMEARERLVAMHELCLRETGMSDVVVEGWVPPIAAWQWGLSALCLLIFGTFPFRESLRPESGSLISGIWSLGGAAPGLASLCYVLQPYVLGFMVVVHAVEATWFANGKLKRHWVEFGTGLWWCWVADCLVEGIGCMSRFDGMVKAKEAGKKGGKH